MGAYTNITKIVAPSSAPQGSTVPITIKVKNIWDYQFAVYVEALYDSEWGFDTEARWIYPGETLSFSGSFIMPDSDITIHACSYVLDGELGLPEGWHRDDEAAKDVSLGAEVSFLPLLAILGGIGILGVGGIAVALAARPRE